MHILLEHYLVFLHMVHYDVQSSLNTKKYGDKNGEET